ncbi:MAG: hypothetical protein KF905_12350 [Flavobacteriales bacterium]|nr:hypothetical protein [Flavobacteriales bacterium]
MNKSMKTQAVSPFSKAELSHQQKEFDESELNQAAAFTIKYRKVLEPVDHVEAAMRMGASERRSRKKVVSFNLDVSLIAKLRERAASENRSASNLLEVIITQAFAKK